MDKIGIEASGGGDKEAITGREGWTQVQRKGWHGRKEGTEVAEDGLEKVRAGVGLLGWLEPRLSGILKAMLTALFYIKRLVWEI